RQRPPEPDSHSVGRRTWPDDAGPRPAAVAPAPAPGSPRPPRAAALPGRPAPPHPAAPDPPRGGSALTVPPAPRSVAGRSGLSPGPGGYWHRRRGPVAAPG